MSFLSEDVPFGVCFAYAQLEIKTKTITKTSDGVAAICY